MGRFPEYNRQVAASPLNAPTPVVANTSIGPGLAAVGQGISQLGVGLGTMVARREAEDERARREANETRVNSAKARLARAAQERYDALSRLKGENAITGSQEIRAELGEEFVGIVGELTPEQQRMLDPVIEQQLGSFEHMSGLHVAAQTDAVNRDSDEAILTLQANKATGAIVGNDTIGFEEAKAVGLGQIDAISRRSGDTPVMKQAREFEYVSSLHMAAIEQILAVDPERAAVMFDQWNSTLDQTKVQASKLRERVEAADRTAYATKLADSAIAEHGADAPAALDAMAKEGVTPEARALAIDIANKRLADNEEIVKKADGHVLAQIGETIGVNQGRYTLNQMMASPEFAKLQTQEMRTKAINMTNAAIRARRSDATGQASLDQEEWYRFLEAVEDNPDLADEGYDVNSLHSNASPKKRAQMAAELANVRTRNAAKNALPPGEFSKVIDANIPAGTKKEDADVLRKSYLDMLQDYRTHNNGKNPPRKDVEAFFEKEKEKVEGSRGKIAKFFGKEDYTLQQERIKGRAPAPELPAPPVSPSRAPTVSATKVGAKRTRNGETRTWDGQKWVK